MTAALELAKRAGREDEVPVGAIIVKDGEIVSTGYNRREQDKNVLRHAEIIAIDEACTKLGAWRLSDCQLYVTLEPCLMCVGAIYQARIERVIYGAYDKKAGALGSLYDIHQDKRLNHNFEVTTEVMKEECSSILSNFFRAKRNKTQNK